MDEARQKSIARSPCGLCLNVTVWGFVGKLNLLHFNSANHLTSAVNSGRQENVHQILVIIFGDIYIIVFIVVIVVVVVVVIITIIIITIIVVVVVVVIVIIIIIIIINLRFKFIVYLFIYFYIFFFSARKVCLYV